jgi:thymidine kinase
MGFLTLIFGTMACGKTAELLKIVSKLQEHNSRCHLRDQKEFAVFKPSLETRDAETVITSRSGQSFDEAIAVKNITELGGEILQHKPQVIIIDECQFFEFGKDNDPQKFIKLIRGLLKNGRDVILCGLIQNCYGGEFEILSSLCHEADEIINPHTTCSCGKTASRTQRLQMGYPTPITDPIIVVDDDNSHDLCYSYEPRCKECWEIPDEAHPHLLVFRQNLDKIDQLKVILDNLRESLQPKTAD